MLLEGKKLIFLYVSCFQICMGASPEQICHFLPMETLQLHIRFLLIKTNISLGTPPGALRFSSDKNSSWIFLVSALRPLFLLSLFAPHPPLYHPYSRGRHTRAHTCTHTHFIYASLGTIWANIFPGGKRWSLFLLMNSMLLQIHGGLNLINMERWICLWDIKPL